MDPYSGLAMTGISLLSNLFGKKSSTWSGTQPKIKKLDVLNKDQQHQLHDIFKRLHMPSTEQNPLYQQGSGYLSRILSQDPEMMRQFEAPALRQFNEQIVPQIAERFAGMGALSSGAFNQTMGQEAGSLAERLAQMRAGLGMQAQQQALGYAHLPFEDMLAQRQLETQRAGIGLGTQPFRYVQQPGTPGAGTGLSNAFMGAGSTALGSSGLGGIFDMIKGMFGGGGGGGGGQGSMQSVLYPSESAWGG